MATEGDTNTTENKVNNNNENTAYNNTENKVETQSRRRRTSLYTRARKSFFRYVLLRILVEIDIVQAVAFLG